MFKRLLVPAALLCASASGAAAQMALDLDAMNLELSGPAIVSSDAMAITDVADADFGSFVIPGFFQGLDPAVEPSLELNTADAFTFNLSYSPGDTGVSFVTERTGDRQLELLFDMTGGGMVYGLFVLAEGDSLDNLLTGATFQDAELTIWQVEARAAAEIPLPAGGLLLLGGLGAAAWVRRRAA